MSTLKPLCEVEIGFFTDARTVFRSLEEAGYENPCEWSRYILGKVKFTKKSQTIPLFLITNKDLGLTDGADYRDAIIHPADTTLGRALSFGFKTCNGEVGPALLLQHPKTIEEIVMGGLAIGMEAIVAQCGWSSILDLHEKLFPGKKPFLSATRTHFHSGAYRFLFTR